MDVFFIFASVAFFIWSIRSILYFVNEWQSITAGRLFPRTSLSYIFSFFFSPLSLITWAGVFFSIFVSVSDFPLEYDQYFILGLFLIKAVIAIGEISRRKVRLPRFTPQISIIIVLSLIVTATAFSFPLSERYLWLLFLDRLLLLFVVIPIFLVMFPNEIVDDFNVRRAARQMKKYKKLKKILILGKDAVQIGYFLDQLLNKNKEVVMVNDPYMRMSIVGKSILSEVTQNTDYLIVVYPNTSTSSLSAILNTIYFSSVILSKEKTPLLQKRTLSLLIPYVMHETQLFLDTDYKVNSEFLRRKRKNVYFFDTETVNSDAVMSPNNIQQRKNNLTAQITYKDEIITVSASLIGKRYIIYLIPAMLFSAINGIKEDDVKSTLKTIVPIAGQFVEHKFQSGVILIDASLTHDKAVIKDGLQYLKLFRKNKVIVFAIEDELTKEEIKELKADFALANHILVVGEKHQLILRRLMKVGTDKVEVRSMSDEGVLRFVRDRLRRDDVIIFLGRNASLIVESILLSSATVK